MLRAVTYARVSSSQQAEKGYSLPEQQRMLAEHCARHGYLLIEHVVDGGISGTLEDRPALNRVLELVEARVVDLFVAMKIDRLGRENRLSQNVLHQLRQRGIRIEFVEHASGDSPADRLLLNVLGGVAEFEHAQIRERTNAGRYAKAKSGKMPGGPTLYGYRQVSRAEAAAIPEFAGRGGEYLIVESEAAVVREMFARAAAGWSDRRIATWLTEQGLRTRAGALWTRTTLRRMLTNTTYYGTAYYGTAEHRHVPGKTPAGRPRIAAVPRPREEWIEIPVPPIVSEELWRRAQQRREDAGSRTGRPSSIYLLTGVTWCGLCRGFSGQRLRCESFRVCKNKTRPGYEARYYQCQSRRRDGMPFCGTRVRAETLEQAAHAEVERIVRHPEYLIERAREHARQLRDQAGDVVQRVEQLQRELAQVTGRLERLADEALKGVFPSDILGKKAATLTVERERIQAALRKAREALGHLQSPEQAAREAAALIEEIQDAWAEAGDEPVLLQQIYQSVLRVTVAKGMKPTIQVRNYWLPEPA
ncbi:MAG: recombinase family protein [Armatimonadota bacterium]